MEQKIEWKFIKICAAFVLQWEEGYRGRLVLAECSEFWELFTNICCFFFFLVCYHHFSAPVWKSNFQIKMLIYYWKWDNKAYFSELDPMSSKEKQHRNNSGPFRSYIHLLSADITADKRLERNSSIVQCVVLYKGWSKRLEIVPISKTTPDLNFVAIPVTVVSLSMLLLPCLKHLVQFWKLWSQNCCFCSWWWSSVWILIVSMEPDGLFPWLDWVHNE